MLAKKNGVKHILVHGTSCCQRVVITGLGAVTPYGVGVDKFWSNLVEGKSGISVPTIVDLERHVVKIAGEVKDFNVEDYIDPKEAKKMDRFIQFAVVAADEAIKDAGLDNIYSMFYSTNEIGYFCGVVAAAATTSDMKYADENARIGFIGGMDIPGINDFMVGYVEGAKAALAFACKKLDKAVAKGFLHKNNAARHKSSLCKKVNSL